MAGLDFWLALLLIVLAADLAQCWTHRACHELPALWRLHAVHHSVEHMDWMAGSRQHLLEVPITRRLVLAPIAVLGFAKEVIDACIVVVGFQAVYNHANVSVRLGPPRYLVVTPDFHHWHHAQDSEAIDRNCAAHFAFLDHLFGTAVQSGRAWPALRHRRRPRAAGLPAPVPVPVHLERQGLKPRGDAQAASRPSARSFCSQPARTLGSGPSTRPISVSWMGAMPVMPRMLRSSAFRLWARK